MIRKVEDLPMLDSIMKQHIAKLTNEWDNKLKNFITEKLNNLGYHFDSESEFLTFVSKMVSKFSTQHNLMYHFYLDFIDDKNKGIHLGSASRDTLIEWDGNRCKMTIGEKLQ
jgi:valyl-tRNA synthetase